MPLGLIYAAQHTSLIQMGHEVNYPAVLSARRELTTKWLAGMLSVAKAQPMEGVLNLD